MKKVKHSKQHLPMTTVNNYCKLGFGENMYYVNAHVFEEFHGRYITF